MGVEAALIAGGASLIGGAMGANATRSAANRAASAQKKAAQIAADAQRFRPVGVTTRFGQSAFEFDRRGNVSGASYTPSEEIKALQDRLSQLYGDSLGYGEEAAAYVPEVVGTGRGLFGLGQQYLAESPDAARQRIFNELQDVRLPAQMREEQRLGAGVFGRGRAGLNISGMGQPELFALAAAREEQRARDAFAAEQQAQQQIEFGRGLLGGGLGLQEAGYGLQSSALGPFQTQFGLSQTLEEAARAPLDIGAQLGGRSAQAGANVGQTLLQGGQAAANLRLQGSLAGQQLQTNALADLLGNRQFQQGASGLFGNLRQMASPIIYGSANVYGPYGTGTVPTLNANPAFGSAGYYATDI